MATAQTTPGTQPRRGWLNRTLRDALSFDTNAVSVVPAVRAAAGFILVLVVGVEAFGVAVGASAAVGALLAGMPSVSVTNNRPLATMAATTVGIAFSAFVASAAGSPSWLHLVLLAPWALFGGLLVALGDAPAVVGMQATIGFIVFGRFSEPPLIAATLAGYIAIGGSVQVMLVLLTRSPGTLGRQRRALALAYRQLADVASGAASASSLQAGASLDAAAMALSAPSLFRRVDVVPLQALLDEGRRIRVELSGIAGLQDQRRRSHPGGPAQETVSDRAAAKTATVLGHVADVLERRTEVRSDLLGELRGAVAVLRDEVGADTAEHSAYERADALDRILAAHLSALAGQLRAVASLAERSAGIRSRPAVSASSGFTSGEVLRRTTARFDTLRANITLESTAFRHALRLAVVAVAAELVGFAVPFERGYWIAVAAVIVLKPDFATTYTRGIARVAGSLVGAALAGAIAEVVNPSGWVTLVVIAILGAAVFVSSPANYSTFSIFITALIVLLVSLEVPGTVATAGDRLVDTVIGGAMALVAYALWPSWSGGPAKQALAKLLTDQRTYVSLVLATSTGSRPATDAELTSSARKLRLTRTNAEALLARAIGEPVSSGIDPAETRGMLAGMRRISQAAHTLRFATKATKQDANRSIPQAEPLVSGILDALTTITDTFSMGRKAGPLPPLRRLHEDLSEELGGRPGDAVLLAETDELVDATNSIAAVVDQHLPTAN